MAPTAPVLVGSVVIVSRAGGAGVVVVGAGDVVGVVDEIVVVVTGTVVVVVACANELAANELDVTTTQRLISRR